MAMVQKAGQEPPKIGLTTRDIQIFEAILAYDGMLGMRQIQRLFFSSYYQTRIRLAKLYQNGYLDRPDRSERQGYHQMPHWLGKRGAEVLAGRQDIPFTEFKWRKRPRPKMIPHDLQLNDFRLDFEEACRQHPAVELEEAVPGSEFWTHPEQISYTDVNGKRRPRQVRPDGLYIVRHWVAAEGQWYRFPLFIEIDMGGTPHARYVNDRVLAGIAYLKSTVYRKRFGFKWGSWLWVTTSEERALNMKRYAEAAAGDEAQVFYYTWFDQVGPETILAAPIWYRGGEGEARALFPLT